MIIITGDKGQIGSALVDDLQDFAPFEPFLTFEIEDKGYLIQTFERYVKKGLRCVIHLGAISSTISTDQVALKENNVEYSLRLMNLCIKHDVQFIFASSASIYGNQKINDENSTPQPLNDYARSKLAVDQDISNSIKQTPNLPLVSLRFFNVYGGKEEHKTNQQSGFYRWIHEGLSKGTITTYEGAEDHMRDFVHVSDVVDVIRWFIRRPWQNGVFNVGTGDARSFGDVAKACQMAIHDYGYATRIVSEPYPEHLKGKAQTFTRANMQKLRSIGYCKDFVTIEKGARYCLEQYLKEAKNGRS